MKKNKPINMATGGLMSQPPYIAKNDPNQDSGITPYDVNTPQSARQGMPSRLLSPTRTRFKDGGESFPDLSGDGTVTQKDILIGKGVIKKAKGGLMKRMKFGSGELSTKEIIEMKRMEQLEAMEDSGLPLTEQQEKELEEYKAAKSVKAQMALGGAVGIEKGKYDQRPDYLAFAEGDVVDEAEKEAEKIANFVNDLVESNRIKADAKDNFFNMATENGIEYVENILVSIPEQKLSDAISDEVVYSNKQDVLNAYKSGKINASEYAQIIKNFK